MRRRPLAGFEIRLAFLSDRDGSTQLHVLWLDTREVAQLTRVEKAAGSLTWSPDGTQIAFTQLFVSGIRKPDAEYLRGDSEI